MTRKDRPNRKREKPKAERKEPKLAVVAIGTSAGGLTALKALFQNVPPDSGLAFVVIIHLSPEHESHLADLLQPHVPIPVQQVTESVALEPNRVYVIPPNRNLSAVDTDLRLTELEKGRHERAPIDHFLRSLADDQGYKSVGVILSGTATDGTLGLTAIKAEGGITFAQDDTAQHTGMPRNAIAEGCVDFVLPPDEIAKELARIARHPLVGPAAESIDDSRGEPNLNRIIESLRFGTGVDFRNYKRNTLYRRILRRVVLHKLANRRQPVAHGKRHLVAVLGQELEESVGLGSGRACQLQQLLLRSIALSRTIAVELADEPADLAGEFSIGRRVGTILFRRQGDRYHQKQHT